MRHEGLVRLLELGLLDRALLTLLRQFLLAVPQLLGQALVEMEKRLGIGHASLQALLLQFQHADTVDQFTLA